MIGKAVLLAVTVTAGSISTIFALYTVEQTIRGGAEFSGSKRQATFVRFLPVLRGEC